MEHANKAIRKACESGYRWTIDVTAEKMFLDPLFWQALGKDLWDKEGFCDYIDEQGFGMIRGVYDISVWTSQWHRFIDHLAEGKPANDFFKHLLDNQN